MVVLARVWKFFWAIVLIQSSLVYHERAWHNWRVLLLLRAPATPPWLIRGEESIESSLARLLDRDHRTNESNISRLHKMFYHFSRWSTQRRDISVKRSPARIKVTRDWKGENERVKFVCSLMKAKLQINVSESRDWEFYYEIYLRRKVSPFKNSFKSPKWVRNFSQGSWPREFLSLSYVCTYVLTYTY